MSNSNDLTESGNTNRRGFLGLLGGGVAVSLAGCSGGGDDGGDDGSGDDGGNMDDDGGNTTDDDGGEDSDGEIVEGGQLNLINAPISTFDPIASTDTASARVLGQSYENLVHYPNGESELENQLVENIEISDDNLTYTFTIKEGVSYHDNDVKDELTAHDFEYAWRRLAEASASERASFMFGTGFTIEYETDEQNGIGSFNVAPDSLGLEVVDDYTLEMSLQSVEPATMDVLAYDSFAAMPEGLVDDIQGYEDAPYSQNQIAREVTVGTGPFTLDTFESGSEAVVTAFDDYHGEGPYLDSVHWEILSDDEAIFTYGMERNADIIQIPTGQYDQSLVSVEGQDDRGRDVGTYGPVENGDTLNYFAVPTLSVFYVAFNASRVPRPVRQAVAYVTNHEELINQVFKGRGAEAWSFTPPAMWPGGSDAYNDFVDQYPYGRNETNLDQAQQVLEEAGYTQDNPFEMTLTTYESAAFQQFARLTRDKLSGTGVEFTIDQAPFNTLIQRGENGELDMYSLGWIWSWIDPAYGLFGFEPENTNTDEIPESANGYYLDWQSQLGESQWADQAQEAWERAQNNPGPDSQELRDEAWVEIEEARQEDMVLLPLYHELGESFRYDWANVPKVGGLGSHRMQYNTSWLDEDAPNREPN